MTKKVYKQTRCSLVTKKSNWETFSQNLEFRIYPNAHYDEALRCALGTCFCHTVIHH